MRELMEVEDVLLKSTFPELLQAGSNSYRVTTCSLWADFHFQSRPLLCTRCPTWDHNKHQA